MRISALRYQLFAALLFAAVLFVIRANVESGMNDDWSFIRTARDLAHTGQLRYNGWSAPLIGFQAYWGALFVKLFGFSFTAVRASVWILTLLSIPVFWSVFRMAGGDEKASFFGTLTFLFSPLILPNSATFMTDMPAFLLFAAALLCALKAWSAESKRAAMRWTMALTLFGLLSGSVRQIYWASGVCFLVVLAWKRFRSMRGRSFVTACLLLTLALGAAGSHWLGQQPYVPAGSVLENLHELSWPDILGNSSGDIARDFLGLTVLAIPFSLLLAVQELHRVPFWLQVILVLAASGTTYGLSQPMPWLGNTISSYGIISPHTVIYGEKPQLLSPTIVLLLGTVGITTLVLAISSLVRTFGEHQLTAFATLTFPFLVAYTGALAFRATSFGLFDRYMIPLLFLFSVASISAAPRLNRAAILAAVIFGVYALATTHDYFAEARAKLQAATEIMQAGHPRTSFSGGFEFDAWTQADLTGFVNNDAVDNPPDAYRDTDDCTGTPDVQVFWREETPDVKAQYVLSLTPLNSLKPSNFPPVRYHRWLPPGTKYIYINKADPPLTCPQKLN